MPAVYFITDKNPTFLDGDSSPVGYFGSLDYEETPTLLQPQVGDNTDEDINFCEDFIITGEPELPADFFNLYGEEYSSASWAGANHNSMTNQSMYILNRDNNNNVTPKKISDLAGKYSSTALGYIKASPTAPDATETKYAMAFHYYRFNADLENGEGCSKELGNKYEDYERYVHNASWQFNDHYYRAVAKFKKRNWQLAYNELGYSIHYLQDANAPHHAALKDNASTNNGHTNYETWVKNNFYASYWEICAAGLYNFMVNSSNRYISNNFSKSAFNTYSACANYAGNSSAAINATDENLKRTQRAVAGLYYRYLINTGRCW